MGASRIDLLKVCPKLASVVANLDIELLFVNNHMHRYDWEQVANTAFWRLGRLIPKYYLHGDRYCVT